MLKPNKLTKLTRRNILVFQEAHAEQNTIDHDDNTEHIINADEVDRNDQSNSNRD